MLYLRPNLLHDDAHARIEQLLSLHARGCCVTAFCLFTYAGGEGHRPAELCPALFHIAIRNIVALLLVTQRQKWGTWLCVSPPSSSVTTACAKIRETEPRRPARPANMVSLVFMSLLRTLYKGRKPAARQVGDMPEQYVVNRLITQQGEPAKTCFG